VVTERRGYALLWVGAAIAALVVATFVFLFRLPENRASLPMTDATLAGREETPTPAAAPLRAPSSDRESNAARQMPDIAPPPLAPAVAVKSTPAPLRASQTVALPEIGPHSTLPFIAPGTPTGQSLALLRPYADKGHQKAACLIAAATTPCRLSYDYGIGDTPTLSSLCADVTRNDAADTEKYLWQTAQNGNADARAFFLLYPPVSNVQLAASEEYEKLYRERAPQLVLAGVQGGNPTVLWIAFAQAAGMAPNATLVAAPRSDYYAIVYGTVLRTMIVGPQVAQIDERLVQLRASAASNGVALARALKEAEQLREQRFSGKGQIPIDSLVPKKIECN
jgi:hypothetical protein